MFQSSIVSSFIVSLFKCCIVINGNYFIFKFKNMATIQRFEDTHGTNKKNQIQKQTNEILKH
jgi:hypothetical protein